MVRGPVQARRPYVSLNLSETKAVVQRADMAGGIATGTRGTTATMNRWQRRRTSSVFFGEVSMSSKSKPVSGNNKEPSSDLSRHYRQIGIKAVAAASAKTTKRPHDAPITANRKEKTNHEKEDSDE